MALNTKFNAKNGISVGVPSVSLIDNVGNAIFPTVSSRQYLGLQPSLSGLAALVDGNSLGSALTIGTNDNYSLNLETGGSTRMTVTSAGNVGIGTTTPSTKLEIVTTGTTDGLKLNRAADDRTAWLVDEGTGSGALYLFNGSNSNSVFITGNGNSYINSGNLALGMSGGATARLDIDDTTLAGSGALSGSILNLAQTWNTSGTPTAIKLNVTDTASNAASNLMDLQVSGVSKFKVDKVGAVTAGTSFKLPNGPIIREGAGGAGAQRGIVFYNGGDVAFGVNENDISIKDDFRLIWASSVDSDNPTATLALGQETANILAQRNGVSPQAFRLYNSYTDASNYERFSIRTNAGTTSATQIGLSAAGTGQNRDLEIVTGGSTRMTVTSAGNIGIGTATPNEKLTVAGNISSSNIVYALGGNSSLWNSAYTSVNTISANGATTYTTVNTNSANWSSVYSTTNANSANWSSVYTTTNANSANWNSTYTTTNANSANWNSTYTTVNTNSANYILDGGNTKGANLLVGTNDNFNLNLETAGTTKMTVTSAGNVGIGTITPDAKLHIVSLSAYTGTMQSWVASGHSSYNLKLNMLNPGAVTYSFDLTNNNTLYSNNLVLDRGNVGIGTAAPNNKLDVIGNAFIGDSTTAGTALAVSTGNGSVNKGGLSIVNSPAVSYTALSLQTNWSDGAGGDIVKIFNATGTKFLINNNGNVGIGTATPNEKLTVAGNISSSNVVYASGGNSNLWNSAYSSVNTISANGATTFTTVNTNSAAWSNAYTTTNANSANWSNAYTTTNANSANWSSVYTTSNANSASWSSVYSSYNAASATILKGTISSTGQGNITIPRVGGGNESVTISELGTSGNPTFNNLTVSGNLSVVGDFTYLNTGVSVTSALSVVNTGTGPALVVRQSGTTPIAHFIDADGTGDIVFDNNGFVGLGTATPNQRLTVVGGISSTNVVYASGGNSDLWNSAYTSVNTISANGATTFTTVNTNSANWSSVYTLTNSNSANWSSVYTTTNTNSAGWASAYTTTNTNSAKWNSDYTTVNTNSAKWDSTYTTVNTNSANYILDGGNTKGVALIVGTNDNFNLNLETAGTTKMTVTSGGNVGIGTTTPTSKLEIVDTTSAISLSGAALNIAHTWNAPGVDVTAIKLNVNSSASGTNSKLLDLQIGGTSYFNVDKAGATTMASAVFVTGGNSNLWNSNYTTTNTNSAKWASAYTTTNTNSANWSSVYTTVNANSASYIVNGGNTLGGTITIGTNDANNFNLETSGTARVSISSTGQVGIGTTTPDADLVVYKNVTGAPTTLKIRTASSTASRLDFYRTDAYVATRFDVLSTNEFQFYNNNDVATPKYIISGTTGNFGIGTTSTAQKVTIGGSLSASGSLYGERAILGDTAASVYLERDAINALGIRNSTAAQTLNVYGTYTSVTNFERLTLAASSLGGVIGHYAGGGGGVARDLLFQTSGTTRMTIAAAGSVNVAGHFSAATKSFLIDHPTQEGKKLQYGVVESNQHSVLVRGKTSESIIELPEEWSGLVHKDSVTVQLTPIGSYQQLYVVSQDNQRVVVGGSTGKYNYTIYGERKDVDKLITKI